MDSEGKNTLEKRIFYINSKQIVGSRLDPRKYNKKYQQLFSAIDNVSFPRKHLRELIVDSVAGNWGKDDIVQDENLVSCLAIRAT